MTNHETFGRKVIEILTGNAELNDECVFEIAILAVNLGLVTGTDDGGFKAMVDLDVKEVDPTCDVAFRTVTYGESSLSF